MIIEEKGLCRAIKAAYKTGGYKVMADGGSVMIWTTEWFVQADAEKLPKKVFGLLVEHMGTLPGKPTYLQKGTDPQLAMENMAEKEVDDWMLADKFEPVKLIPVSISGMELMQTPEGVLVAVDPETVQIVKQYGGQLTDNRSKVVFSETGEWVAVEAVRFSAGTGSTWTEKAFRALEQVGIFEM